MWLRVRNWSAMLVIMQTIQERRVELGMTQKELAALAGVNPGTISRLESGSLAPSLSVASKVARALELPIESLVWIGVAE